MTYELKIDGQNMFSAGLVKCENMYNLNERIKQINPNYELLFNQKTKRYEVHDISNLVCSKCLEILPCNLDARLIEKLYKTRKENMKKLFIEMELENRKLEEQNFDSVFEKSSDAMREIVSFASRTNKDLTRDEMKNIISNLEN